MVSSSNHDHKNQNMTSPDSILFVAIRNRINAITINSVPAFPWIDQDLMQLESHNGDNRPPVSWPAVTIDIEDGTVQNLGDNSQTGILKVCIRIGFAPFSSTSNITPAPWANKALEYYDLEQAIHLALHGWTPGVVTIDPTTSPATSADLTNIFGHFIRSAFPRTEKRNDRIRVRVLSYIISMDDYTTSNLPELVPATPNLSFEISIPG